ncbi:MAG: MliC family protein [Rickettsiales bacterium]|jgi:membrane-bound inhibitor of C-type lysozyme|nr:MliC family protein [Rickettsiales bacterium]
MKNVFFVFFLILSACCSTQDKKQAIQMQCGTHKISIEFYTDYANLYFNGKKLTLDNVISASGAKYEKDNIVVWNKAKNTIFIINDKRFTCKDI